MSYEDAQRVAQLKLRPERFAKMRQDHNVRGEDPFWVDDFLAPDPPQIYGMLPAPIGRWVRARGQRWRADFDHMSMPMRVRINRPWGYPTMSFVAAMRHLRRRSLRHHEEVRPAFSAGVTQSCIGWGAMPRSAGWPPMPAGWSRATAAYATRHWMIFGCSSTRVCRCSNRLGAAGGNAAAVGDEALKLLASEAGKGAACLYLLRDRLAAALPASSAAA